MIAHNDNAYDKVQRYVVQDGAEFYIFATKEDAEQMENEPVWICRAPFIVRDHDLVTAQAARMWFETSTNNIYNINWL